MVPLDPPGSDPRRFRCVACGQVGETINDLYDVACTAPDPDPCEWCGETPECAPDCVGVALALSGAMTLHGEVYVSRGRPDGV